MGLGLPTIVLGMLAIPLGVTQVIAVLLVPSLVTNGVQDLSGPRPLDASRRFWPLLLMAGLGTIAGTGVLARGTGTGTGPAMALGSLIAPHGLFSLLARPPCRIPAGTRSGWLRSPGWSTA